MSALVGTLIGIILIFNLFASYWNARVAGNVWKLTKVVGGYRRFMCWVTVLVSAAGFAWVYTLVVGFVLYKTGHLTAETFDLLLNLSYIVVAPVIVLGGYAFTFDAWKRRIQEGRGTGVALWNSGASIYNTVSVARNGGKAWKSVFDGIRKNPQALIAIGIFACSLLAGALTTYWIVRHYIKNDKFVPVEPSPVVYPRRRQSWR